MAGVLSYVPHRLLIESPVFAEMRERQEVERLPVLRVLRQHSTSVLAGIGATAVVAGFHGILFAYLPTYLVRVAGYPPAVVASAILVVLLASCPAVVVGGALSDLLKPRVVLRIGALVVLLVGWSFFRTVSAHGTAHLAWWLAGFGSAGDLAGGAFGVVLVGLFPTGIRLSGVALSYNISFAVFSGLGPLAALGLIFATGNVAAPAIYLSAVAMAALLASFWTEQALSFAPGRRC